MSESFGSTGILGDTNFIKVNLRFPGQYFDIETGLHYNYHRDYSSVRGAYIQADPLGVRAGLNQFTYVSGDPLLAYDDLGLCRTVMKFRDYEKPKNSATKILWQNEIIIPHWDWTGEMSKEPPERTKPIGDICYTPYSKIYLVTLKEFQHYYVTIVEFKNCLRCEECGRIRETCDNEWQFFDELPGRMEFKKWIDTEYLRSTPKGEQECLPLPPFKLR